ncbi:MAG: LLM class F420-dependent oxidoreductase [Gammaproteobacteria bacterium]|mgnify:FL=1|nr:LLM class F420-dependent oxidoreductase [Gammaproteobacteria bacterium]|tara:strand:- start:2870 stop:3886 length:1017 start_codon:yes stop_codon:yes gene_type:complete
MKELKLGIQMGYWGAQPPVDIIGLAKEAENLGYDAIWSAESWGSDVFTPLAWIGSHTSKIKLGTGIAQISARTPAATAMAAITLDHLTKGRVILGLGVSGPQVVEGWYGQPFSKPLSRTREYVGIIKKILEREEPVSNDGEHYPLPYVGEGSWGLGKSLKPITHPLRANLPIFLGAEGPKNVSMTAEIAEGWLPLYYSPYRQEVYADQIKDAKAGFEISAGVIINICDDVEKGLIPVKNNLALYIGGMGAAKKNFHTDLMGRMGFEEEALKIQELFLAGKRTDAAMAVPDKFADEISLVGPKERIKERVQAWRDTPITSLLISTHDKERLREVAEIVL